MTKPHETKLIRIMGAVGGIVATILAVRLLTFTPGPMPIGDNAILLLWPGSLGLRALEGQYSKLVMDVLLLSLIFLNSALYAGIATLLVWSRRVCLKVVSHA